MRLHPAFAILLVLTAASASAAPPVIPGVVDCDKVAKTLEPGTAVEMPYLMAPLTQNDKLFGYAYIASKVLATSPAAADEIRDKIAFVQDAFVRDVNGPSLDAPGPTPDDPPSVDTAGLGPRLTGDAARAVGAAKVKGVLFCQIQIAPLHPRETPVLEAAPADAPATPAPAAKDGKPGG